MFSTFFFEVRKFYLGLGRFFPVTDLVLGLERPSSYAGARSLVKALKIRLVKSERFFLTRIVVLAWLICRIRDSGGCCTIQWGFGISSCDRRGVFARRTEAINSFWIVSERFTWMFVNLSTWKTVGMSMTSETSMFGRTSMSSCKFPMPETTRFAKIQW